MATSTADSAGAMVDKWLSEIESACNSALLDVYDLSIANAPVDVAYARGTADCIAHRVGQIREAVAAIRAVPRDEAALTELQQAIADHDDDMARLDRNTRP